MKAYTLRLSDNVLTNLKFLSLHEKKTVRQILLEIIEERLRKKNTKKQHPEIKQSQQRMARLLQRVPLERVVESIREDRER